MCSRKQQNVTVRGWIWCSEQEERSHCTSKLTSRQWIEWYFFKVIFAFVVMLSSKMALMLCRKIILLCFFTFGVMEERNLSVFIFSCPLMSRLFCHSRFCAPIILFNGHVNININAFILEGCVEQFYRSVIIIVLYWQIQPSIRRRIFNIRMMYILFKSTLLLKKVA